MRNYKHTDGIAFAARSRSWTLKNSNPVLPRNRLNKVATSKQQKGVRAYYRVLAENNKKYILIACHVNMHGFHRGDLRFVEVNDRTIAKGFENFSVIGRLFTGDVVAVTSLAIKSKSPLIFPNVDNVHPDGNCIWEVKEMTVLTRKDICDANFATLENGTAILEGYGEAMNVDNERNKNVRLPTDKMYSGKAFFPEKMVVNFTEDFHNSYWEDLIALSAKMISYPNSLGTVFSYSLSETQTRLLEIGTKAFDTETFLSYPKQRDEIVEKCVRMGASAVQAVLNGRFDARGFQIKDIIRKDFIVQFSIANPAERPTEGRWNNNMRVMLNGGGELLTGVIETVLVSDRRNLQIVVRIPSNSPKNIDFSNKWVVHQQESPLVPICEIGFFKKMHATSNGRRTIETLYGGPPIQINRKDWQSEFVFPAKQPIALNEFQNQYVRLILADVPLVIGNSPFGCGKSMTIVTAAIEIHKRNNRYNKYGKKQLLITQSNNAGVSLVEISQKIVGNSIKFLRYVSEPNWNLLPDSSRTVIDMPVLMKHYFVGWALGTVFGIEQTKHLTDEMKRAIVRKVIQDFTTPEKLQGEAKTIYENMETMHKEQIPLLEILIEAFFVIYNPDVIVSTADSYKCLVKLDILKHVSNIQIDEASQLPEYTLIYLLQKFPNSGFGLVGDIKQLPPHCDSALSGLLKKYGIGNTMERAARADVPTI